MPAASRRTVKKSKIFCGQCRMEVEEGKEDNIECDKCAKTFHVLCTKLDKRQYVHLLKNDNEEYVCHVCVGDDNTVGEELKIIKTKLNKLDQLTEMQETMNFMSTKFDEILKGVAENKNRINSIEKENRQLKCEIKTLQESVKMLNDQRVKNDCIISGPDFNKETSAADVVIDISKKIGVDMKEENIQEAYFLKTKNQTNSKQSLVVKFNTRFAKEKLMAAKPKLKENSGTKSVYINDFLSKESMELFTYARSLKSVGYQSIYTYGGRIFAKKGETTRPRLIKRAEDVDNILLEATTNNSHRRRTMHQGPPEVGESDNCEQFLSPARD